MPLYLWSVLMGFAPFGCPGRQLCLHTFFAWFIRQHRPTFSRLPPTHSAATPIWGNHIHRPSSKTAMTCFRHLPALSGRVVGRYLSRFAHPLAARFWARLPIHSLHFLPLLAGVCPFINLPVCLLYDKRTGGSVNSPYDIDNSCSFHPSGIIKPLGSFISSRAAARVLVRVSFSATPFFVSSFTFDGVVE